MNARPNRQARIILTGGMIASAVVLGGLAANAFRTGSTTLAMVFALMACIDAAFAAVFAWKFRTG